jgi:23S rRNA (adenine2503-C2)-methyltransferase
MNKLLINNITDEELLDRISDVSVPAFRLRQIREWLYKCVDFDGMSNIPKSLIEVLKERFIIDNVEIYKKLESKEDETKKYLLKLYDGEIIEAVAMVYKHGVSICVSTQVGCNMGCVFCSSAIGGMRRNLSAYEMLAQVQAINADLNAKASNVVLMGTGEPLLNYNNVVGFMKLLHEPDGINMSYRNMSVSTCGIVKNMYRLAEEEIPVNLCVSLHQADDELREGIMPSAKNYKIQDIMDAADSYFEKTGRRITIEYALIEGVNDSNKDIDTLIKLLHGKNILLNLIPLNSGPEDTLKGVSRKKAYTIMEYVKERGINATVRRTLGADIDGACGQLRARELKDDIVR